MADTSKPVRFIGVSGPAAAGKDTVANMICELFGAENLSTGNVLRSMARHIYRLSPDSMPTRDQLYTVGTFLRTEVDPAFTIKVCIEQAKLLGIGRVIMSGLRTLGEAEAIQQHGGIIVGVRAVARLRYDRIHARARDSETNQSFEYFLKRDELENRGTDGRGISSIVEHADIVIDNGGISQEELQKLIQEKLTPLLG